MSRIRMPDSKSGATERTFREVFQEFVVDATARGLSPKTLRNYDNHFHCVSRHIDVEIPLAMLTRSTLNEMVVSMWESGLSSNSISSYTRVVGTFLNWCDKLGYCHVEMPKYRQQETIKERWRGFGYAPICQTILLCPKAKKPCATGIFDKKKRTKVAIPMVS